MKLIFFGLNILCLYQITAYSHHQRNDFLENGQSLLISQWKGQEFIVLDTILQLIEDFHATEEEEHIKLNQQLKNTYYHEKMMREYHDKSYLKSLICKVEKYITAMNNWQKQNSRILGDIQFF